MQHRSTSLALALVFGLVLPFIDKPVHVDDANFLALARGAALDPWRPHALSINWEGRSQQAFEVLSNPPGIGWWLAPAQGWPEWGMHLWMLPWLALALWGAWRLGDRLAGSGMGALLLVGCSPMVLLAAQALTPDLPLLACTLAGLGGFLGARRAWPFALLAGCAVLFRYSGLCLIPLVLLAGWQRRRWSALLVGVPLLALALHDLHAYGRVHLLAMVAFQSVSNTPWELFRKLVAALAMLGGAGLLPLASRRAWPGAALGALLGVAAALLSHQGPLPATMTVLCSAAGGQALARFRLAEPEDRLLAAWGLGGLVFLLTLRFEAARYWLPFLPAPILALLRQRPSDRTLGLLVAASVLLGLGLSIDDRGLARAQRDLALELRQRGTGSFAGHWGWQYYMEQGGWRALEEGGEPEALHAEALAPWPQQPAEHSCLVLVERRAAPDRFPGPRSHSADGGGNLHSFLVAGQPPVETYAPWSFSDAPYDEALLYRRCP